MRKITIAAIVVILGITTVGWGETSQLLYTDSGSIAAAHISADRLIVQKLNAADIVGEGYLQSPTSNQQSVFSPDGSYQLVMTFVGSGDYYEVSQAALYRVADGTVAASLNRPGFSDAVISDQGNIVGIMRNINIAEKSRLLFLSPEGKLLKAVDFPMVTQVRFAGDVIGALSGERGLVFFNRRGDEMGSLGKCQWFDHSSAGGELVCAATDGNMIKYFSGSGVSWEKEFGSDIFRAVAVDIESGSIAAVSRKHLYVIDWKGHILHTESTPPGVNYTSCDINNDGNTTYAAWGWEYDTGRGVAYDKRHTDGGYTIYYFDSGDNSGSFSEDLSYSRWNVFTPSVTIHGGDLIIQTMDEIRSLSLSSIFDF